MNESTGTLFFRSRSMFTPVSEPVQYTDNTTLRHTALNLLCSNSVYSEDSHASPQAWARGHLPPKMLMCFFCCKCCLKP